MSTLDSGLAEPAEVLSAEVCRAALRTVCQHATGVEDALELAKMLDLLVEPEPAEPAEVLPRKRTPALIFNPGNCMKCGDAMNSSKAPNGKGLKYGGRGRCTKCYAALRRAVRKGKA